MMNYEVVLVKYNQAVAKVAKMEIEFAAKVKQDSESTLDTLSAEINTAYKELKNMRKLLIHI